MAMPVIWRRVAMLGAVVLIVLGAALVGDRVLRPRQPDAPASDISITLIPRPVAVAERLYLLGKSSPAAVYCVDTCDGLVLVDTGLEAGADAILKQLADLRLDANRLRAILLTHVHADHSLGAEQLRKRTSAKVYAGRADAGPLRQGGPREAFFSTFHMPQVMTHATVVDVELAGGETIEFGDTRFLALGTPGHTPGSICYLLDRPGLRALFTGDVIQCLKPSRRGALGTYVAYLPPRYRGDVREYLTSLRRLRELAPPDMVLPGHPWMDPAPQSPRLTVKRWHDLLDEGIAEMEQLLKRYDADGADFLDGNPKELLPGLHYLGDAGGTAVYALEGPRGIFLVNAPGGPKLVDFLAERFRALGWKGKKPKAVLLTSVAPEAIAGLAEFVRANGCQVIVPKAGLEDIRRLCPADTQLLTEEDFDKRGWFDAQAIPVAGCPAAQLAFRLRWAGKTIVFSGRIPTKTSPPFDAQLMRDVTEPGGSIERFLKSLDRLAEWQPDLWLPAAPVHGQNANLYDRDWATVLEQNRQLFP